MFKMNFNTENSNKNLNLFLLKPDYWFFVTVNCAGVVYKKKIQQKKWIEIEMKARFRNGKEKNRTLIFCSNLYTKSPQKSIFLIYLLSMVNLLPKRSTGLENLFDIVKFSFPLSLSVKICGKLSIPWNQLKDVKLTL